MSINLKQLEAFVWVSDLGSFRKAAERLNTTQPNISTRISTLEKTLNVQLFERDTGVVHLTVQGKRLLTHARKVLKAREKLIEAADQTHLFNDVLRLGVTELVVRTWLREFMKAFKLQYPNIIVELTVDLSTNLEKDLMDRSIDLAFQNGPFDYKLTGSRALGVYPLIWIASPDTKLKSKTRLSLEQLVEFPILTNSRGTHPYDQIQSHFAKHRDIAVRLVTSSNLTSCIHMAVDSYGIASVPHAMVINELKNKELIRLNYSWTPNSLEFFARYEVDRSPEYVVHASKLAAVESSNFLKKC